MLPSTGVLYQFQIPGMAKPGRRVSTPSDFRLEFIKRVKKAREDAQLSQERIASELSHRVGRRIAPDTYRKYEKLDGKKGALLPHDLIIPFCEICGTEPFELLTGNPFNLATYLKERRRAVAA